MYSRTCLLNQFSVEVAPSNATDRNTSSLETKIESELVEVSTFKKLHTHFSACKSKWLHCRNKTSFVDIKLNTQRRVKTR